MFLGKRVGMNFKKVLISDLIPDTGNPRKDLKPEDPEYQQIKTSIESFGDLEPIVFNTRTKKIVGGHQRLKVFKEQGLDTLFVVEAGAYSWAFAEDDLKELTPEKEKAANIALNKIGGSWDFSQLSIWLSELKEADFDISITGFSDEELKKIDEDLFGEKVTLDTEPQISRAEELRKEWGTELGQLWQCGEHRVLCGDCTDLTNVKRLIGDEKADIMVTDPPYGVEYDPQWRTRLPDVQRSHGHKIQNDDRCDWCAAWKLFEGDVAYVWHAGAHSPEVAASLTKTGLIPTYLIIWNKDLAVFGRGDYHHKHEPCWYSIRDGGTHHWIGGRDQKTVWDIPTIHSFKNGKNAEEWNLVGHGTQKPLDCMSIPIKNHAGGVVYDPFLGSGTTMIACENLGRKCRGCEIDPGYVAVILQRYKDTFNKQPVLLEGN